MKKEAIRPGIILRVVSPHGLGAPKHAIATVETVGTSERGDWLCTIRYDTRAPTRQGLFRSHLWESDLSRFEIVTDMNTVVAHSPFRRNKAPSGPGVPHAQLEFPFQQDQE